MKNNLIYHLLILMLIGTIACNKKNDKDYLTQVLSNLEKIQTASYYVDIEGWLPGDTASKRNLSYFIKEYANPSDSTIGSKFVWMDVNDTTLFEFGYDGMISASAYHDKNGILVDDFTARPLPFRPINVPFFNRVSNIIRYILETPDSITVESQDMGDHYHYKLTILEDDQVEFFGKAHHINNPYQQDPISRYELWISKKNNIPHKLKREMSHDINITVCRNPELNTLSLSDFNLYDYFPKGYEIRKYELRSNTAEVPNALIGKRSPEWTLNNVDGNKVSLADFKSKAVLINLTGIGCGPCLISIPSLNKLMKDYSSEHLSIVAIECWGRKKESIKQYINKNHIDYPMLEGSSTIQADYQTKGSVPVFILLDKDRVVRNVFNGFSQSSTETELRKAIDSIL
ncbi:MAG: TlpA family protein disulfide reductase [Bacteroidales bacterium]